MPAPTTLETAYFGGGCFWCTEALFETIPGVKNVTSGYADGTVANPTYEQVSQGNTGHAEVVKIQFDPQVISYQELVEVFFELHDPTTPNQQGADRGEQYRSIILYTSDEQKQIAQNVVDSLENAKIFPAPIVTEIVAFQDFYEAEDSHQNYYATDPQRPYCQAVISPKLQKLRAKLAA